MSKDLVERAAAVARERFSGASAQASETEARVLAALRTRSQRRTRLPVLAVPLIAALLASVAWAGASEGTRARLKAAVYELVTPHGASRERSPVHEAASAPALPVTPPAPASAPLSESNEAPLTHKPPGVALRAPGRAAPAIPSTTAAPPAIAASATAESGATTPESDALYRAAHQAQFGGHDAALALMLWDRYLAAAPNGSLSLEARYNRAIALARLGRNTEAISALEPFARGDYGPYRQSDASSLLEALRNKSAPLDH
jgi:hypothetical protein